jgi:hypothetical protein
MTRTIGCVAIALATAGCEPAPFSLPADERLVVQAYLYAGEPVQDIRITSTLPLGSTASVAPPVNDAEVTLRRAGQRYVLVPAPGDSGYYHYPGSDLVVAPGDVFDLEVTARGATVTARTTVPPRPDAVSVSPSELRVDGVWATEAPVVRWPNPGRDWYFITHRNAEADPEPIFEGTIIIRQGLVVSEPVAADSAVISVFTLRHFGRYDVKVFRVNEEYVRLYMSLRQDTRDLNEPATNIENGIGIFTAFSSGEASFTLVRD